MPDATPLSPLLPDLRRFAAALMGASHAAADDLVLRALREVLRDAPEADQASLRRLLRACLVRLASNRPQPALPEGAEALEQALGALPILHRAALLLVRHVAPDTCVPLLRVAEAAAAPCLAAAAAAAVAEELEALADDEELAAAVKESAQEIRGRQATDSIPVLDEIAFHVRRLHGGDDEDWDDGTSASWDAPGLTPEERAAAVAAARHGAAAVRLRKMAVVRQLAAAVQGWEVRAVRTHT